MCEANANYAKRQLDQKIQEAIQLAMGLAGNSYVSDGNRLLYQHQTTKLMQVQSALGLVE